MSCNYAEGLSPYENKGKCGQPEKFDSPETVQDKVGILTTLLKKAGHVVFHTGAGVSTSAGIPDFRGPKGVWTLEKKGLKPDINVSWDDAKPTFTHRAISALQKAGYVQYVITQNIDGLHLKSGLPRSSLSELHGNMFIHQCNNCKRQFVRNTAVPTVGEKCLNIPCPGTGKSGRGCRGKLYDNILDWEGSLPDKDLELAEMHSEVADLSVCLGTTLQIVPSGNLPTWCKKHGGKLAICNLQPTKHDKKADVIINTYVDDVLIQLCKNLGVTVSEYSESEDPTKFANDGDKLVEWTIPDENLKNRSLKTRVKAVKQQIQSGKMNTKRCASSESRSRKRFAKQSDKSKLDSGRNPVPQADSKPEPETAEKAVPETIKDSEPEESVTDESQSLSHSGEQVFTKEDQNNLRTSQSSLKTDSTVAEAVSDSTAQPEGEYLTEASESCTSDVDRLVSASNGVDASNPITQKVITDVECGGKDVVSDICLSENSVQSREAGTDHSVSQE